jgi:hypothetical protein
MKELVTAMCAGLGDARRSFLPHITSGRRQTEPVADVVDVILMPYLPLGERATVGDWELIPRTALQPDDCLDARAEELARGLADVYVLPKHARTRVGAFVRPRAGLIGDESRDMQRFDDLRRACVAAVLDPNPDPTLPEDQRDWNAGHWMLSTENATVVGHGINRDGFTGTSIGSRFPYLSIGVSVVDQPDQLNGQRGEVLPPADVRVPTFRSRPFDGDYANAVWESVRREDDASRRLGVAIDWLAMATLNTASLKNDVRVPSLRAGLEALLDTDDFLVLGERLSALVEDDSPKVPRDFTNRRGAPRHADLGDVAWWCVRFSFLRNKLMHGSQVMAEDWFHGEDQWSQIDLGDWYLRQAIKYTVYNDGHPEILHDPVWRRAFAAFQAEKKKDAESEQV